MHVQYSLHTHTHVDTHARTHKQTLYKHLQTVESRKGMWRELNRKSDSKIQYVCLYVRFSNKEVQKD